MRSKPQSQDRLLFKKDRSLFTKAAVNFDFDARKDRSFSNIWRETISKSNSSCQKTDYFHFFERPFIFNHASINLILWRFRSFCLCRNSLEFSTETDQFLNFIKISDFSDNEYEMYTWENLNRQYSWYLRRASSTSKISDSKFYKKFRSSKNKRKPNFSCQNFLFRHMPGFSALLGTLKLSNLSLYFILWHFMPFYLSMYLSFLCHFWYSLYFSRSNLKCT